MKTKTKDNNCNEKLNSVDQKINRVKGLLKAYESLDNVIERVKNTREIEGYQSLGMSPKLIAYMGDDFEEFLRSQKIKAEEQLMNLNI